MTTSRRDVRNVLVAAAAATAVIVITGCGVLPGLPDDQPAPPAVSPSPSPATAAAPSTTPTPTAPPDDTLSSPMTEPEIGTARRLPANLCDVLVASDIRRAGLGSAGGPRKGVIQGAETCARAIAPGPTAISVSQLPGGRLRQLQQLPVGPESGLTEVAGNTAVAGCQYAVDLRANVCLLILALRKDSWALVSWSGKTALPTMGKTWDRYYPTVGGRFPKA